MGSRPSELEEILPPLPPPSPPIARKHHSGEQNHFLKVGIAPSLAFENGRLCDCLFLSFQRKNTYRLASLANPGTGREGRGSGKERGRRPRLGV